MVNGLYGDPEPARAELDAMAGAVVVEFGAPWCGHCQGAQPLIHEAFAAYPGVAHLKIEDGRGKRLGRSFQVKLWPTLIFLKAGQEVARAVRPTDIVSLTMALQQLTKGPESVA